jgi:hypothetical protein
VTFAVLAAAAFPRAFWVLTYRYASIIVRPVRAPSLARTAVRGCAQAAFQLQHRESLLLPLLCWFCRAAAAAAAAATAAASAATPPLLHALGAVGAAAVAAVPLRMLRMLLVRD